MRGLYCFDVLEALLKIKGMGFSKPKHRRCWLLFVKKSGVEPILE